jgi:two-component system chemotaxis response regulator CheB
VDAREDEPVQTPGSRFDVVAIASSAGGVHALSVVLGGLRAPFGAAVVLVQHLDRRHDTVLDKVLARRTLLPVRLARFGDILRRGTVHIAPPDHHLLVEPGGRLTLTSTELVHFVRPSADLLFESVAGAYGPRAIGCVLTGSGQDGATGVAAIKARGGTVIVEDPKTAAFTGMPEAAAATGSADLLVPLARIATVITDLVEARN